MNEKKIICRLMVTVYSDGSSVTEKLPIDTEEVSADDIDKPSSKMVQIVGVLSALKDLYQERYADTYDVKSVVSLLYSQATKQIAAANGVSPSSVADKMTRQCCMKKNDWIKILIPYLEKNDLSKIKVILTNNIVKGKIADMHLIEEFLEEQGEKQ